MCSSGSSLVVAITTMGSVLCVGNHAREEGEDRMSSVAVPRKR